MASDLHRIQHCQVLFLQIPIGQKYHCKHRGRGILVRSFHPKNVPFRQDCIYQRMLDRCKEEVYPEEADNAEFYIADSRGVGVCSDNIAVDGADGTTQEVPWSIATYIQLSNIKYPSKV